MKSVTEARAWNHTRDLLVGRKYSIVHVLQYMHVVPLGDQKHLMYSQQIIFILSVRVRHVGIVIR